MKRYLPLTLAAGLVSAAASAQTVDLTIKPASDKALRYTITSQSEITNERETLVNGEPREGGFGGGSGVTKTDVQVVFDEGSADNQTWRAYHKAQAVVERPGRDGEPMEQKISGGLAGKKVYLSEDDGGVVAREGDAKGKTLPAALTRGLPVGTTFAGFAPKGPVAVGQEFDLSASLPQALKSLVHPVRPQADEDAEPAAGQRRRGEGQGEGQGQRARRGGEQGGEEGAEQGGDEPPRRARGGRGEGGFGGRGPGGFGARNVRDIALETAVNDKLSCKATGKLVAVEERDGMQLATISFNATMSGKGTPTQLGLGGFGGGRGFGGFGGGQGGRGGQGGEPQEDTGKAEANVALTGSIVIDVASHTLRELTIDGKLKTTSHTTRSFERPDSGEAMDIEINADSDGTFKVKVAAATPEK